MPFSGAGFLVPGNRRCAIPQVVRGSPDPAPFSTEGLQSNRPEWRPCGQLKRRGRETDAERCPDTPKSVAAVNFPTIPANAFSQLGLLPRKGVRGNCREVDCS